MTQQCMGCADAQEKAKKLDAIVEKYKDTRGALIQVLHEVQEVYGYLPLEVQRAVSEKMNIPLAEIYGVVSFYTQFSIYPKENTRSTYVWVLHATLKEQTKSLINSEQDSPSTWVNALKMVCFLWRHADVSAHADLPL